MKLLFGLLFAANASRLAFGKFQVKWDASFRWSFHPNSAWGNIEMTTIGKTHPTVDFLVFNQNPFSKLA